MSHWINFDLLMAEIGLHRSNAQREILNYKNENKPFPTSPSEYTTRDFVHRLLYENEVGKEIILMCLEVWCNDFKFSSEEVKDIIAKEELDKNEKLRHKKRMKLYRFHKE